MTVLPQFPLHVVLFPTMVLPLHVFEPRYRAMIHDTIEGDRQFGVVMIERGKDTGGDDQRADVGTVARLVEAEPFPDGRWAIVVVGLKRFRVTEWLEDDPYPRARIEMWPDGPGDAVKADDLDRVANKFRRCMALASEAGIDVGEIPAEFDEPELAAMQMSSMLPIGSFDKQKLLSASTSCERLRAVEVSIDDTMELIDFRLHDDR